jgi:hypothetical protein
MVWIKQILLSPHSFDSIGMTWDCGCNKRQLSFFYHKEF